VEREVSLLGGKGGAYQGGHSGDPDLCFERFPATKVSLSEDQLSNLEILVGAATSTEENSLGQVGQIRDF